MGEPARPIFISRTPSPEGEPLSERRILQMAARRSGAAIGSAQVKVRRLPALVAEIRERITRGKVRREESAAEAGGWRQTAERKLTGVRRMAEDNPLYVIAGAGCAAFVLGFAGRIWRSRNARG